MRTQVHVSVHRRGAVTSAIDVVQSLVVGETLLLFLETLGPERHCRLLEDGLYAVGGAGPLVRHRIHHDHGSAVA